MTTERMTDLHVRVPDSLRRKIRARAKADKRTASDWVRLALEAAVKRGVA
jgi:plasmid stability protein